MKTLFKRLGIFVSVLLAGTGLVAILGVEAHAASESKGYFYDQISKDSRAEKVYQTFEDLEKNGQFKDGKIEYDLIKNNVFSESDISQYIQTGDEDMFDSYMKGRDAYYMDHPDLFYVDIYGLTIQTGMQGNTYAAYLDSSNSLSLYMGDFTSKKSVEQAMSTYENKLTEIVNAAKAASTVKEQIEYVNQYLVDHIEYSYGTYVKDGRNVDGPEAPFIRSAYGALVYGKAVCEGYAKAFQAILNRLGIPCVCIPGYGQPNQSNSFLPHMWNYVELDGVWYAVDVTWNDTENAPTRWLFVGESRLFSSHLEERKVSYDGPEFRFPAIKPYDYGNDQDDNGMTIVGEYSDSSDQTGKVLYLTVSYEDKNATELQEEGKYLAFRSGARSKTSTEVEWGLWYNVLSFNDVWVPVSKDQDHGTQFMLNSGTEYIQFGLLDYAPDDSLGATYPNNPDTYGDLAGTPYYYAYKPENLNDSHFIGGASIPYHNNEFGSYLPAPGGIGTPSNTGDLPVDRTYDIKITYNTSLKKIDKSLPVEMEFYTSKGNSTVQQHATISNVKWDGDKVITFTFTPSLMYEHNLATYYFTPTNLVGAESEKVPDYVAYTFKGKSVVCSKVFNDGRQFMKVFGEPKMLDTSDLSVTDFKDENGNYFAQSQRSQLLLVASKPSAETEAKMDEVLKTDTPIQSEDIVASSTYEIDLQICGLIRTIPNGSYLQVAFGFPEGYSKDDAGTTFKIYHYKHDDKGNITGVEEIPVIVTEYGLIARVNSFSPFTIVQLKNTSAAVLKSNTKNIYANVNGNGGSIKANGKGGIAVVEDKSITYTIEPEKGYQIAGVILNGKALESNRYKDGTLTLSKEELEDSNMLEVSFITEEFVKSYSEKGFVISNTSIAPAETSAGMNIVGVVVTCVVLAVVLAGGSIGAVFYTRKKQAKADK